MILKELAKSNIALSYRKNYNCRQEPVQELLDEVYKYIDPTSRFMHRLRINLFTDLMKGLIADKLIERFDNALDIGCNGGFYSKLISDYGFANVKGIDIDPVMLAQANKYFTNEGDGKKITFENLNAEELPATKKYDFILCTEVIEHTRHPEKVIDNIKNILNPGGIAIITLPNALSYSYLLTYLSYKIHGRKIDGELKDHLSYPSFRAVSLFKDKRMKLLKTSGTNLFHWYFLHKVPGFALWSRLNFELSRIRPINYFSQFFFMVFKKEKES